MTMTASVQGFLPPLPTRTALTLLHSAIGAALDDKPPHTPRPSLFVRESLHFLLLL